MIPSDFKKYVRSAEFKDLLARVQEAVDRGIEGYFDEDNLVDVAEYYHMKGDDAHALKVIDYLLYIFPDSDKGLVFKGRQAIMNGDIDEAERIADRMKISELPDTVYLKAELMLWKGDAEAADKLLMKHCPERVAPPEETDEEEIPLWDDDDEDDFEDFPSDRYNDYLLDVALMMCDYNHLELAEKWMSLINDKTYETEPDYMEVKARIATGKGRYEESIGYLNKCIDEDSFSPELWLHLSKCQYHLGQIQEALQSAEYAEAIASDMAEVYLAEGCCHVVLSHFLKAVECFEKYCDLTPLKIQGFVTIAGVLSSMGNFESASSYILKAVELFGKGDTDEVLSDAAKCELYRQAASVSSLQHNEPQAMYYIDRLEMYTDDPVEGLLMRGGIKLRSDDTKGAMAYFTEALEKTHHDPDTYIKIGCMWVDEGLCSVGYTILSEVSRTLDESGGGMPWGWERLAFAALETNHYDEFLETLAKAIEYSPVETVAMFVGRFPEEIPLNEWVEWARKNSPLKPSPPSPEGGAD